MASDAQVIGPEEVLQAFDRLAKTPYWSILKGKDTILCQYGAEGMEKSREELEDNLVAGEQGKNRDLLRLRFHPKAEKGGFITEKTPSYSNLYFRICPPEYSEAEYRMLNSNYRNGAVIVGGGNQQSNPVFDKLASTLQSIDSRLAAMESDDMGQIEDDDIDKADRIAGVATKVLDHPVINAVLSKFMGIDLPTNTQPTMLSGLPPQEQLQMAINRLIVHDPDLPADLERLANLADKNKSQFDMLLSMLRKM